MGRGESSSSYSSSSSGSLSTTTIHREEDMSDLRKGPWTVDEDLLLVNYITIHGEGRWNSLARCAGLKRTGKSCRLRWLNYLRPDVRRGNITPEEQLLILQLHARWGNRWSKIAQHLPRRTDNEIKNYWRTRVQKQAKQLKCDVNSQQFKNVVEHLWMPRLMEKICTNSAAAAAAATTTSPDTTTATTSPDTTTATTTATNSPYSVPVKSKQSPESSVEESSMDTLLSQVTSSSPPVSELTGGFYGDLVNWADEIPPPPPAEMYDEINQGLLDFDNSGWWGSTCDINIPENFWNSMDDFWS